MLTSVATANSLTLTNSEISISNSQSVLCPMIGVFTVKVTSPNDDNH